MFVTAFIIHPGHPDTLYISSIGCLNLTKPLQATEKMDFVESAIPGHRDHRQSAKFRADRLSGTDITSSASRTPRIVIADEPDNVLPGSVDPDAVA